MSLFNPVLSFGLLFANGVSIISGQREYWFNMRTADKDYCGTDDQPGIGFINKAGLATNDGGVDLYQLNPGEPNEWKNVTFTAIDIGDIEQLRVNMGSSESDVFCFDRFEFGVTSDPTGEIIGRGCSMEYQSYARIVGDCEAIDDTSGLQIGAARRLYINVSDTSPICWNIYNTSITNKTDIPYIKNEGFSQFTEAEYNTSIQRRYEFNFTTLVSSSSEWDCGSEANVIVRLQSNCTFHEQGTINNPTELYSQCIEDRVVETTSNTFVPGDEGTTSHLEFIDSDIGDPTHLYLDIDFSKDYWCLGEFDILLTPNSLSEDGLSGDKWVHCNVEQLLQEGIGLDENCHDYDGYTGGIDKLTLRIDEYAPYCDVYYVLTPAPTLIPTYAPTDYDCYIGEDDVIVSWDDLNAGSNFSANISLTQGRNNETGIFEVTVDVESKYVVGSTFSAFKDYYKSVTESGYLGVTYVLDTNEFETSGRLLSNANTCENRLQSSFNNSHFLNDYWDFTLSPSINNRLGNDDFGLEYGNQNIWDISMITNNDTNCGNVHWTNTFSFYDLWYTCKDSTGSPSYELVQNDVDKTISLNLVFYLTLVSPNPLYLTTCDNGATDCGQYLIQQLISHPMSIIFSQESNIISTKDDVRIDLFGSLAVGVQFSSAFSRRRRRLLNNDTNGDILYTFELTVLTTVPFYMALDVNTAVVLSPTEQDILDMNSGSNLFTEFSISEDTSDYATNDCLLLTSYRCWQRFIVSVGIGGDACTNGTGIDFSASYIIAADFKCIANDTQICDDFLDDSPLSITLDGIDVSYSESCDFTRYEVSIDWNGDISFYKNNSFSDNAIETEYQIEDTVYTRVSIEEDLGNYQIFGFEIVQCLLCTSSIADGDSDTLSSCLDTAVVDDSIMYVMPNDELEFTLINSNTSDTHEDFSFKLPALADDIFYVECTVDLTVNNRINNRRTRRRARMLSSRSLLQDGINTDGSLYQTYIGQGTISSRTSGNGEETGTDNEDEGNGSNGNNNSNDGLGSFSLLLVVLMTLTSLLIIVIVGGLICYIKANNKNKKIPQMMQQTLEKDGNAPVVSATTSRRPSMDSTV